MTRACSLNVLRLQKRIVAARCLTAIRAQLTWVRFTVHAFSAQQRRDTFVEVCFCPPCTCSHLHPAPPHPAVEEPEVAAHGTMRPRTLADRAEVCVSTLNSTCSILCEWRLPASLRNLADDHKGDAVTWMLNGNHANTSLVVFSSCPLSSSGSLRPSATPAQACKSLRPLSPDTKKPARSVMHRTRPEGNVSLLLIFPTDERQSPQKQQ